MTDSEYTHLCLVVDRSGSMQTIYKDMNGAIQTLLDDQAALDGTIRVDVVLFDTTIDVAHENVHPSDVRHDLIEPRGMTALNDAIGVAIKRLGNKFKIMDEGNRPSKVIVVVVTDGGENSSREYTAEQIKAMVTEQTDQWGWQFTYLAANVDAFATGSTYGFAANQTLQYVPTASGATNSFAAASANITRSRLGDDSGYTQEERESST